MAEHCCSAIQSLKRYDRTKFQDYQKEKVDRIFISLGDILNLLHHLDVFPSDNPDIQSMYLDTYNHTEEGGMLNISPGVYNTVSKAYDERSSRALSETMTLLMTSLRGLYSVEHQCCKAIALKGFHYCFIRTPTTLSPLFEYHFSNTQNLMQSCKNLQNSGLFYDLLNSRLRGSSDMNLKMLSISATYIYWLIMLAGLERDFIGLPKEALPEIQSIGDCGRLILKTLTEGTSPCE